MTNPTIDTKVSKDYLIMDGTTFISELVHTPQTAHKAKVVADLVRGIRDQLEPHIVSSKGYWEFVLGALDSAHEIDRKAGLFYSLGQEYASGHFTRGRSSGSQLSDDEVIRYLKRQQ
ncbi:MAG: hypothetical protein AABX00_00610 [Nanoarchaeota archaeon]